MQDKQKHKSYFLDDGHLTELSVALVVDALLYNKENVLAEELKDHISLCQDCQLNIIESYEVMSKEKLSDLHPFFSTKSSVINKSRESKLQLIKTFSRVAAIILIIISIGTVGILLKKQETKKVSNVITDSILIDTFGRAAQTPDQIVKNLEKVKEEGKKEEKYKDPVIKNNAVKDKKIMAQADLTGDEYKLSVTQVAMLGNIMRSDYFKLASPKDSTIYSSTDSIVFGWKTDMEEDFILSIYNNKENRVFKSEPITKQTFNLNINLGDGVYLWHLESEDDIIYTGVFFIIRR